MTTHHCSFSIHSQSWRFFSLHCTLLPMLVKLLLLWKLMRGRSFLPSTKNAMQELLEQPLDISMIPSQVDYYSPHPMKITTHRIQWNLQAWSHLGQIVMLDLFRLLSCQVDVFASWNWRLVLQHPLTEPKGLRYSHFAKGVIHPTAANVLHASAVKIRR